MEDHRCSDHPDLHQNSTNSEKEESLPITERPSSRSAALYNVLFGFLVVVGETGQNVVLPLFIDSGKNDEWKSRNSSNSTHDYEPFMDNLFVSLFSSFVFAVVFGISFAIKNISVLLTAGQRLDRKISHRLAAITGFFCAASAVLIVFSSSGKRTAPYLQAILMNITIPSTLVLRYCILKKSPTKKQLICALAIILSLFVCLLPSIFPGIDPKHKNDKEQGGAKGLAEILWTFCFLLGFALASLAYVTQEKLVQYQHASSKKKVDLLYIVFLTQLFQFLSMLSLFWVDALPLFGSVDSIKKVVLNLSFGLKCFFGYGGCSFHPGLYGSLFLSFYICFVIGQACLLRYSEGATYLAIVSAIVTPAGFFFWTLFKEQPYFHWYPEVSVTVWSNIAGLAIMVPSIYLYNYAPARSTQELNNLYREASPLLRESSSSSVGS